ncbi:MAG: hypothetical protein WAM60_14765 [Candidatus Promineifilaceae bacterium]
MREIFERFQQKTDQLVLISEPNHLAGLGVLQGDSPVGLFFTTLEADQVSTITEFINHLNPVYGSGVIPALLQETGK